MWSREVLIVRGLVIIFFSSDDHRRPFTERLLLLHLKNAVYSDRQCSHAHHPRRHDSVTCDTRVIRTTSKPSILVTIARGTHLFPFRTESLSPVAPMVLHLNWCGRVGSRQEFLSKSSCVLCMQELFAFIERYSRRTYHEIHPHRSPLFVLVHRKYRNEQPVRSTNG